MESDTLESTIQFTNSPEPTLTSKRDISSFDKTKSLSIYDDLVDEAGADVFRYLERFNLIQNQNVILLSSIRHYLYDCDELKQVKTIINLKLITQIKQINDYLHTMNYVLPMNGNLVGCFVNDKNQKRKFQRIIPKVPILNWIQYVINQKKIKSFTKNETYKLLVKHGFLVIDMTEIDGFTYFISQKVSHTSNKTKSLLRPVDDF